MSVNNSGTQIGRGLQWLLAIGVPTAALTLLVPTEPAAAGDWIVGSFEQTLLTTGRWVAVWLATWLMASQVLYILAVVTRTGWLTHALRPITLSIVRRISAGAASLVIGLSSPAARAQITPEPTVVVVEDGATQGLREEGTPTPVLRPLAGVEQTCITVAPEGSYSAPLVWQVRPGDHLWRIAGEHLEIVLDRPPTLDEHTRYWVKVTESARPIIRSGDPDLIFPNEQIPLPPLLNAGIRP